MFRDLPEPLKYVALAGEGFALYKGYKIGKNMLFPPPGSETVNEAKTEAEQILKNNAKLPPESQMRPTYSPSQMSTFADTLYRAMDGAGTDAPAIAGVFKQMQNDLDILLLIDAFGVRKGTSIFASSTPTNLGEWLNEDGMTENVNKLLSTKAKISKRF